MIETCPLCPKKHDSEDNDVDWFFLCSCGCHTLVWREVDGILALEIAPGQFEEEND